jgi:hypothetical protein
MFSGDFNSSGRACMTNRLAFADALPIIDIGAKPRDKRGVTEVRDRALGSAEARNLAETLGAFVDTAKYTCGTQRLFQAEFIKAKNALYRAHDIEVSSGGMLERVVQYGERAVHGTDDPVRARQVRPDPRGAQLWIQGQARSRDDLRNRRAWR